MSFCGKRRRFGRFDYEFRKCPVVLPKPVEIAFLADEYGFLLTTEDGETIPVIGPPVPVPPATTTGRLLATETADTALFTGTASVRLPGSLVATEQPDRLLFLGVTSSASFQREDSGFVLREDGSRVLREAA